MKLLSLKYRIAATILALETVMVGLMLWTTLSLTTEANRARQQAHDIAVISPLREISRIALLNDEYTDIQTYISFVPKTDDGALDIVLADVSDIVVASSQSRLLGRPLPPLSDSGDLYWSYVDISNESGTMGHLAVKFSGATLRETSMKTLWLGSVIALVGMTVIALAGVMMGRLLTRRLEALQHAAQRFAAGDLSVTSTVKGTDEIADLSNAFNSMAAMLREHITEIEKGRKRFELAVRGTNDGLWDYDVEGGTAYFSPTLKRMLGYDTDSPDFPNRMFSWQERIHPDDFPAVIGAMVSYLEGRVDHFACEHRLRTRTGEYIWVHMRGCAILDNNGEPARMAGSLTDITLRKDYEERIRHLAMHDTLTGLPNRALLEDRLQQAISGAIRNKSMVGVVLMDLVRFKEVNDTLGHHVGDVLLQQTAQRIGSVIRKTDTLSRFGGDEFVLVIPAADPHQAETVIQKIIQVLAPPVHVNSHELQIRASIGAAFYPIDGTDRDTLIEHADIAMYASKRGGLPYCFFTSNERRSGRTV